MKFLDIINNTLDESPAQARVVSGQDFENWFETTYRVQDADAHLKKSNVEIRFESNKEKFPGMKMYKEMSPASLYIEEEKGSAFRLLKADFKNTEENIYNKEEGKYVNIQGKPKGNLFELKKSSPSFKRKVMFAEFKKTATRDDFVRKFGDKETIDEWNELKREEQKQRWQEFLNKIKQNFENEINNYNEIIEYIQSELNRIKTEVEGNIRHRLKSVLHGRGWFLVKGKRGNVNFYRINVDRFVENCVFQITKWSGINRIKLDITPSMTENKHLKNDILTLAEDEKDIEQISLSFSMYVDLKGEINLDFAKENASYLSGQEVLPSREELQVSGTDYSKQNLLK